MRDWIIEAVNALGSPGVALLMLLENIFPPIPSELIMPLAGYLSAQGRLSFWAVLAAGVAGSVLGALFWYWVGHRVGEERLRRWVDRHGAWLALRPDDVIAAGDFFRKYGRTGVLVGRLIPVVRTLISVPAGIVRMHLGSFLLYTTLGTTAWTGLLAYAGLLLGERFPEIEAYMGPVTWGVIGAMAVAYAVRVVRLKREI